jgi:hypothetical protein
MGYDLSEEEVGKGRAEKIRLERTEYEVWWDEMGRE